MKKIRYLAIISISLVFIVGFSGAVMADDWTAEDLHDKIIERLDNIDYNLGPDGAVIIDPEDDDVDFHYTPIEEEEEIYLEFSLDYSTDEEDMVKEVIRDYLELWGPNGNNILIIDEITEVDTQTIRIDISSTADNLEFFEVYELMVVDDDEDFEEEVFDFRKEVAESWSSSKLWENINRNRTVMGPPMSITRSETEFDTFEYRPTGHGLYMQLEIVYDSDTEREAVKGALRENLNRFRDGSTEPISFDDIEEIREGDGTESNPGVIEVDLTSYAEGDLDSDGHVDREVDFVIDDRNNVLATVRRVRRYAPPIIEGELLDHPGMGLLQTGQIYYMNEEDLGDLRPRIDFEGDNYSLRYRIAGHEDVRQDPADGAIGITVDSPFHNHNDYGEWIARSGDDGGPGDVRTGLNPQGWFDDYQYDEESFWINYQIFHDENLQNIVDAFHAVKLEVHGYGVRYPEYGTFYFVLDEESPKIEAGLLNEEGVFTGEYGDDFGTSTSSYPYLRVKINDELAGIESVDDIEVRYINVDEIDEEDMPGPEEFANEDIIDGRMDVRTLEDRVETREAGEQIATLREYDLAEGEYLIQVIATDKAGNTSEEDFIFPLEIDASQPDVHNIRLNHPTMVEEITGGDRLNFEFDVSGVEDVVYAINYLDDENEDWVVEKDTGIGVDKIVRNLGTDFVDGGHYFIDDGLAKDGEYEIRIIGDEEGIDDLDELDLNEIDFEELWEEEVREGRRDYEDFRFRVDGRPPAFDHQDIRYITGAGDRVEPEEGDDSYTYNIDPDEADLVNEGSGSATNFGVLYTDMPTFEMKFENLSEVRSDDIEVRVGPDDDERLARVVGLEEDDSGELNQYTLEIQPRRGLSDANHNLIIEVEDIHGNSSEIRYNNLFETSHIDGRIDFNVPEGRASINEGSAFEIYLPDDLDTDTLSIAVDDTLVVSSGNIVGEGDAETRSDEYYEAEEYYKDGDYEADGFDVMFFEEKRRILVFIRMPLTGKVEVDVEVENRYGDITTDSASFRVDNYRDGFGFGRLLIIDED